MTIKVNAVSLNPIDHWMVNGRGGKLRETFQTVRESGFKISTIDKFDIKCTSQNYLYEMETLSKAVDR